MIKLNKLVKFLNKYLKIDDIEDSCYNGLQFKGKDEVRKIAFAVNPNIETINKAIENKADMLIVHHGHFWKSANANLTGWRYKRINLLYKNNISLYASHLPLDRHKKVGNNAQILKLLGAKITKEFGEHKGKYIGWIGKLKEVKSIDEIENILSSKLGAKCIVLPFGKSEIKTIAVCSGGGGYDEFIEALNKRADLYISGEAIDLYSHSKDARMNVIFAGHYATEITGVKALAKLLKKKFHLKTFFIDVPTGL